MPREKRVFFSKTHANQTSLDFQYGNHLRHPASLAFLALFPWIFLVHQALDLASEKNPGESWRQGKKKKGLAFWTLAMWRDNQAIRAFVPASPHREAMQKLPHWCDEAAFADWEQDTADWPSWETARGKLAATGRLVDVLHPSGQQKAGKIETS
jgi:hypothetical protein